MKKIISYILALTLLISNFSFCSYAENKENAQLEWKRHFNFENLTYLKCNEIPSINNKNVYVNVTNGYLYCIDSTGKRKYDINLFQKGEENLTGGLSPVFDKEGYGYIGSGDKNIYKFNDNGEIIWKFKMDDQITPDSSVTLGEDNTLYASAKNQNLYAINTTNGEKKWESPVKLDGIGGANTPVISSKGDRIYVATSNTINIVSKEGKLLHSKSFEDEYLFLKDEISTVEKRIAAGKDNSVYFTTFKDENNSITAKKNKIYRYDENGKELWSKEINQLVSAPTTYKGTLYYKTEDNVLHAINEDTMEEMWTFKANEDYLTSEHKYTRPVQVGIDGTIYVGMGKSLYAINPDGTEKWRVKCDGYVLASSNMTSDGEIYCITFIPGTVNENNLVKIKDNNFSNKIYDLNIQDEDFCMMEKGEYKLNLNVNSSEIKYTSSNPELVSVDNNGNLKALKEGNVKITASYKDLKDEVNVNVVKYSNDIKINMPSTIDLILGEKTNLKINVQTKDNKIIKGEKLIFNSTVPLVADVADDMIEGKNYGQTILKVMDLNYPELKNQSNICVVKTKTSKVSEADIDEAIKRTSDYLNKSESPSDWEVFALNAAKQNITSRYLTELRTSIGKRGVGNLVTDYARTSLCVISAGEDPTNFAGVNMIEEIKNWPDFSQGINAAIWSLIAYDGCNAVIDKNAKNNREFLVNYILDNTSGDGWAFGGGSTPEPDMTGMALYALAPYKDNPKVKEKCEKAIKWLSDNQLLDGSFGSWGSVNSESCSQAIMGITAWGIDPQGEEFTKGGGNAVTALLDYQVRTAGSSCGMFRHTDTPDPGFATNQGLQALAAIKDYFERKHSTVFYKIKSVSQENKNISAIEIYPKSLAISPGCDITLFAKNQDGMVIKNEQNKKIKWEVDDSAIASIDENGVLHGINKGKINITATLIECEKIKDQAVAEIVKDDFEINCKYDNNDKNKVVITIKNKDGENKKALVLIGLYDKKTNNLIKQSYISKDFASNVDNEIKADFGKAINDNNEIRIMIWDEWLKARPLVDTIVPK